MKRNTLFFAAVLACAFTDTFAAGIGITLGSGAESWESGTDETYNTFPDQRHSGDRKINNFGFVVDTTIAKDTLFNYRFSLVSEENNSESSGYNIDMKGFSMVHDFGFGIVRNRNLRLWVGPELKAAFYDQISPSNSSAGSFDGNVWGFGLGPAIGLNIHLPRVVSFSLTGAYYITSQYFGQYDIYFNNTYLDTVNVDDSSNGLFINACILFRFNDRY